MPERVILIPKPVRIAYGDDNTFKYLLNGVIMTYIEIKSYLTGLNPSILNPYATQGDPS